MRQIQYCHSQGAAQSLDTKIEDTPKTLPWTDKLRHFVRFETTIAILISITRCLCERLTQASAFQFVPFVAVKNFELIP